MSFILGSTGTIEEVAVPPPPPPPGPDEYLPVVPGLFTYGSDQAAGRGGPVFRVQNLVDSGANSLRAPLEATGPRNVIIETSGVVQLTSNIVITDGNLTIAGQTAPSPGLMVRGGGIIVAGADNVLMQHFSCRVGDVTAGPAGQDRDSVRVQNTSQNILFDHLSLQWGVDETASVWVAGSVIIFNVSFANCIIAEGLSDNVMHPDAEHSKGLLIDGQLDTTQPFFIGVINNLFAHNRDRNPLTAEALIANNLVYNAGFENTLIRGNNDGSGIKDASIIGNVYLAGADTNTGNKPIRLRNVLAGSKVHIVDNTADWIVGTDDWADLVQLSGTTPGSVESPQAVVMAPGFTAIANALVEASVLANAGSRPSERDATDQRIIDDVLAGTGIIPDYVENSVGSGPNQVPGGWPTIAVNTTTHLLPPFPDAFRTPGGYTNLEKWFHDLAVIAEDKGPPADVVIPSTTGTFDASSVLPGQVIEVASGDRSTLRINNVAGTLADPILVKSAFDGKTTIRRPSAQVGDFLFRLRDCVHCTVDGSYTAGETYGFFITVIALNDEPSSFMHWDGLSSNFKVRKIQVAGTAGTLAPFSSNGVGIQLNDHRASMTLTNNPGAWRENILVEDCDLRNTASSGIYLGPNYGNPASPDDGIPCRNVEVRRILCRDNGEKGIKMTSMIEGANSVHHCDIRRTGLDDAEFQVGFQHGIMFFEGGGDVHNNYVEDSGEHGIEIFMFTRPDTFGPINCDIYNNVLVISGETQDRPPALAGNGIDVGRNATDIMLPIPTIHHNTSVKSENRGIAVNAHITGGGAVFDNIVAGSGGTQISTPASVSESNNQETTVAAQNFVDEVNHDYRLTSSSPARNNDSGVGVPAIDLDGRARPMGSAADQGAYEFVE